MAAPAALWRQAKHFAAAPDRPTLADIATPTRKVDPSMHNASSSILDETIATIGTILGAELEEITIERAVVGLFFTGVKLSNGTTGASATPIKSIPEAVCCPSSAMAMPFPGKLAGRRAADVAREALSGHGIRRAVGIAAVNALADCCWQRRPHPDVELRHGIDAFDATDIRHGTRALA